MNRWVGRDELHGAMGGNITCLCSVCGGPARCPEDVIGVEVFLGVLPLSYLSICEGCGPKVEPVIDYLLDQEAAVLGVALEVVALAATAPPREESDDSGTDQ